MSFKLEFEIDELPRMTNPSGRSNHWFLKKREADKWKALVSRAVREAGAPPLPLPVENARLVLTRFSAVSPDSDGLVSGFKHVIDGLVSAGVLANDRVSNIGMPKYLWERARVREGKIRVEVYLEPPTQGALDV